jgi:hypothetical protein
MEQLQSRTREALRAELEANRTAFNTLVAGLTDADLPRMSANPSWNVCELLHQIVASLEAVPAELQAARRGALPPSLPPWLADPINARRARREARGQTRATLLARYAAAHTAAIAALDSVAEHEWGRRARFRHVEATIEALFRRQSDQLATHAAHILRAGDRR